jgi:diguanylate cyclase (GGDEF)-like protein/PAS domain S-box-containing protein
MTDLPMRILVVDDDATARLLTSAALRKAGFDVKVADGGNDALRQFREQVFELVMLDVDMPDSSGNEVCVKMREYAGDLLPIVMVTGMDDVASIESAYHAGATDFIPKPINWALLGHRVKYLLRTYQAALDLRAAEARIAAVVEAIPDLLFELDIDGRYIDYHSSRAELLAIPPDSFIGKKVAEILPPTAAQVCLSALQEAGQKGLSIGKQFELQLPHGTFWYELSVARKATEAGTKPHFIVVSRNITERKEAEYRITRLAFFDSLTGLPNRESFLQRVDREIRRDQKNGRGLGVLFMDLDGFKNINDSLGHSAGDLILQWVADRLTDELRPSDVVARTAETPTEVELARLGGDEFTALILDVGRAEDAVFVAHRILRNMRRPFMINGREVTLTTSIGIALYPEDGEDAATLLKHADTAMYQAKALGRDNCQFYSASLTERATRRMDLQSRLRTALDRGEFSLVYQPQVEVRTGTIHSVEALLRWSHPAQGMIPPLDFIPLAEEIGLILPIGDWVLRTACMDAMRWMRDGHSIRVAVNLSPVQFRDPNLLRIVIDILEQTGLAPTFLEMEVTEGAVMEYTDANLATLRALRDLGVRIALDDFGTGYSSLSYLKRMPINNLKVDRSFVSGLPHDPENHAIVRAILAMSASLGLSVTAEGVETIEQVLALTAMDCAFLQGYFFSKPVAAKDVPALLARHWTLDGPNPGLHI